MLTVFARIAPTADNVKINQQWTPARRGKADQVQVAAVAINHRLPSLTQEV
jgi:hypothetical protein